MLPAAAAACAAQLEAGASMSTAAITKQLATTLAYLEQMVPSADPVAVWIARAQALVRRTPPGHAVIAVARQLEGTIASDQDDGDAHEECDGSCRLRSTGVG